MSMSAMSGKRIVTPEVLLHVVDPGDARVDAVDVDPSSLVFIFLNSFAARTR